MPIIPPYYEELVSHFHVLSRSRTYSYEVYTNKKGGTSSRRRPNPIDISTILVYNERIYGVLRPLDFLEVVQILDILFLVKDSKKG